MRLYQTIESGAWLDICVDTEALTIAVSGEETGSWGPYASWDALCDAYASVFEAIVAPHGGAEELDATPMDLRAVRAREERRARVVMDRSTWDRRWERARRLLFDTPLGDDVRKRVPKYHREDVDLTPEALADTLTYAIAIETGDEGSAPIGGSKLGGLPDLPPDAEWPVVEGHATALLVQLDFAELARVDASQRVRGEGVFQLFANAYGHGVVRFWNPGTLERRACTTPPQYLEDWLTERPIAFVPAFYFQQTGDTGGPFAVTRALPEGLRSELSNALGGAVPSECFGGNRIFGGDPVDWQAMGQSYLSEELFCQIVFGEGHVSVGVHEADLWTHRFEDAVVGYCGT